MTSKLAVIALGGNSLIKDKRRQSVHDQYLAAYESCEHIADLIESGYNVVITHGNGPQVGFILLRSELARNSIHEVPLDSCGADTQGALGYNFQQALGNIMKKRHINKHAVTVVTQVIVDKNDPAFTHPTKPIGSFYTKQEAEEREKSGWIMAEDSGRGYRRVVASPMPVKIVEEEAIKTLIKEGFIVICAGGGGIPVIENENQDLEGIAAVIDKDYASALLAAKVKSDIFVISTAVEKVCLNYGTPNQQELNSVTLDEIKKYMEEGHFKPGSMLPKIKAAISFLENGGEQVIITNPPNIKAAVDGKTGTRISK